MTIGLQTGRRTVFAYRFAYRSSCVNALLLVRLVSCQPRRRRRRTGGSKWTDSSLLVQRPAAHNVIACLGLSCCRLLLLLLLLLHMALAHVSRWLERISLTWALNSENRLQVIARRLSCSWDGHSVWMSLPCLLCLARTARVVIVTSTNCS